MIRLPLNRASPTDAYAPTSLHRRTFAIILLGFAVLVFAYSVIVPVWEAPDEPGHFSYAVHLRETRTLPNQLDRSPIDTSHHPPLYYLLAALVIAPVDLNNTSGRFRPNHDFVWAGNGGTAANAGRHGTAETFPYQGYSLALHLMRWLSALMAIGTVCFTMRIGWLLFPAQRWVGLLAGALVGFNPQFVFISAAAMNDNLLILAATLILWQTLRALQQPDQATRWVGLGVLLAIATLSKINGVLFVSVVGIATLFSLVQHRSARLWVMHMVWVGVPLVILAGWWFVRNAVLYGELLGTAVHEQRYSAAMRALPLNVDGYLNVLNIQNWSFWGAFGWLTVGVPQRTPYTVAWVFVLVGALLALIFLWRRRTSLTFVQKAALLLSLIAIAMQEVLLLRENNLFTTMTQGRYLFPIIAPAMLIVAWGWMSLIPAAARALASSAIAATFAGAAVWVLLFIIAPAYPRIPLPKHQLWLMPQQTTAVFDGQFALRAYEIQPLPRSRHLRVRLYWQSVAQPRANYSVFVHVLDAEGQTIAQHDAVPGASKGFLPLDWAPEDIVADEWMVQMPSPSPGHRYRLRVGMYDYTTGQRLGVSDGLTLIPMGDFIVLPTEISFS